MTQTLGFIGLGNMGFPMAANLIAAGFRLRVYNRTPAKAAPLAAQGAFVVSSAQQVADGATVVLSMLADDRALEDVCMPQGSFVEKLGIGGIHISLSTIGPATARRLAEHHKKFGVEYVAAPVFGRPEAAAAKRLWVCTSGSGASKQTIQPILAAIGQGVFDFGEDPGAANVVKISANFLIASAMESLGEVFALSRKNGIEPSAVAEMFGKTLFACPVYQGYGKQIAEKRFEPAGFRLALGLKDINLALQTAQASAVPMPVAGILRDRWISAIAKGRENMDWSAATIGIAEDAGLK